MSLILLYIVISGPPLGPHRPRLQDESLVKHTLVDSARGRMDFSIHQCDRERHHPTRHWNE